MATAARPGHSHRRKSTWLIAILTVALVIAGGIGIGTGLFGTGNRSGSPAVLSPTPGVSPSASSNPSPTPASLACRLPVLVGQHLGPDFQYGAWLDTATGAVVADPTAGPSRSYSTAAHHWLPAELSAVSPDGLSYAYVKRDPTRPDFTKTELHVVDTTTGRDSAYALGHGMLGIVSFTRDAIYLQWTYEARIGLFRFDLASHALTKVSDRWNVWMTDGLVAWAGTVNPADPHPVGGMQNQPNQVDRLDLSTGASESWLYRPGSSVEVLMTDPAGHPVVWIAFGKDVGSDQYMSSDEGELILLDRPDHFVSLFEGKATFVAGVSDRYGTWLGGTSGVFLLTPAGELRRVSSLVAEPAGTCQ